MSIIEKALNKIQESNENKAGDIPGSSLDNGNLESDLVAGQPENEFRNVDDSEMSQAVTSKPAQNTRKQGNGITSREVTLDLDRLQSNGMVTPRSANTLLSEQYRLIKRPLLIKSDMGKTDRERKSNLIMVTSSLPSEGKTFTSINLAMSIAMELDKTVLLVDGDGAKSDITRLLGIDAVQGLTDVLLEKDLDLSDVLLRTNVPKLTVLPAGVTHTNVTELLASDDMKALISEISSRYSDRIIIFDTPPLLATSGASVLAGLVGQVVMVIRAESTLQSHVQQALEQLKGCANVSIILNRTRDLLPQKYGYGYGYGYGNR